MSFPKKGKVFPICDAERNYVSTISAALRYELGSTHQATKTVVRWTGVNERTVKNWIAGTTGPSGEHLVELLRNSEAVFEALLRLAGREPPLVTSRLIDVRGKIWEIVQMIDRLLERDGDDGSRTP
ncbi:MAG: hypothetical protein JNK21_07565 [Rhodospirillaceae bacterium]|nr:hypothetical protein [Rhodospirillaceae bacterium]